MNAYVIYPSSCAGRTFAKQGAIPMINYDRKLADGLVEAVEHGDEIRCMEFFEHLIVHGLVSIDMNRTPQSTLDSFLRTIQGHRALLEWAKHEAVEEALAV